MKGDKCLNYTHRFINTMMQSVEAAVSVMTLSLCSVGPGLAPPEERTLQYLEDVAIETAR